MSAKVHRITPCLWFDSQAEAAAKFYVAIFPNSKITTISYYGEAGFEIHGRPAGSVMVVAFELDGVGISAFNGGPMFQFNEAISLQIHCDTQAEIDHYWSRLGEGGDPQAQQCGWLKDRFGLWWQIVPACFGRMMTNPDRAKSERVMAAVMQMRKIDLAAVERAFAGA